MPKKPERLKNPTVAVSLTPQLIKDLDKDKQPGETRSAQFRRLLSKALKKE
jgi:hypothetical protein